MNRVPKLLTALAAGTLLCLLLAASAAAEPRLSVRLDRIHEPLHIGDERLAYEVTVKNEASAIPEVGNGLTCSGTPEQGVPWSGKPAPTFAYEWLRNGTPIAGATAETYVVTVADEGDSIQCAVIGTNDPDGAGSTYAPITAKTVSLPPVVVKPEPPSAPPGGSMRPDLAGSAMASTPSGSATAEAGSAILSDVVSSVGSGEFTNGSAVVEEVAVNSGFFEAFQAVAGTCVVPGSTISKVEEPTLGSGILNVTLDSAATCSGPGTLEAGAQPFSVGQEISGSCIPAGAEIIRATNQGTPVVPTVRYIEMDVAATCMETDMAIKATSTLICIEPTGWGAGTAITWSYQWLRNGKPIAGATSSEYTVQSADTEPASMLQCEAMAEDAEGQTAIAVSVGKNTRPVPPSPYLFPGGPVPTVDFENQTSGEVTLKLELPAGEEINVLRALGGGWRCTKAPPSLPMGATVSCVRSDSLPPQASHPSLEVVTALGKNPPVTLVTKAEVSGGGASEPASTTDEYTIPLPRIPFGFRVFEIEFLDDLGNPHTRAGGHPTMLEARLEFNTHETPGLAVIEPVQTNGATRTVRTLTPPGFAGNPRAVEVLCSSIADVLREPSPTCPDESVAGFVEVETVGGLVELGSKFPIFAIEPEVGTPVQFAFRVAENAFTLTPELRAEDGYAISVATQPVSKYPEVLFTEATFCGFGAKPVPGGIACRAPSDPEATELPFLTHPTTCDGKPLTRITADSWEGDFAEATFESPELEGCEDIEFDPTIDFEPTSNRADSPTGMNVVLEMPTNGLEGKDEEGNRDPEAIAQANLEGTTVTLPEGMAVNPSSGAGQGACSLQEMGMSAEGVPNDAPVACPDSSKLGTVQAETPLLDHPLNGTVYLAKQGSNPFDSLLALYLVIDSPEDGILIKLAGKVSPNPTTGQLTVSFDGTPQAPLAKVELRFAGGNRAALINPPSCGSYAIEAEMTPWGEPAPVEVTDSFEVASGPGGGACPNGALEPKLRAGVSNPQAGATSPFTLDLSREDGTQRFRQITATTPPGLTAYLKAVPYCPDAVLSSIPTAPGTGQAQLNSPACPQASQVGTVITGAGAGPDPLFLDTGKVYLAGPYKGAPLSLAVAAPAVTGPFDLGNVVVRTALNIDPATARITAVSDPIPTILEGIPLDVRQIRINVDRPNFTLAPTNCEPLATTATVTGEKSATVTVGDRFQVGGCERLGFKPNLALRLKGSPKRGSYQKLTATLKARPGDANIRHASVALPGSIFLAQEHIGTVCTRVQYAADQCPKGSIYGKAKARSPLVDYPLTGTVYLRSSSNPLPDMVINLKGPAHQPIEVDLVGRIDSKNGGIRSTFDTAPDAPVSSFTLEMRGGKKSLLVASRNLCKGKAQKASVKMGAQNGRVREFRPVVKSTCGSKGKGGKGKGRGR